MKKKNKKDSKISKKLKEKIRLSLLNKEFDTVIEISKGIIKTNPNNIYGYDNLIRGITYNYNKYLNSEEMKEVKDLYEKACNLSNTPEKENFKKEFTNYLYDVKEVDNLYKIKKDIISNELLNNIYLSRLKLINQSINTLSLYDEKGAKIKNVNDLINAIFLVTCLVINIMYTNCLLIFTIPFGVYGIINIYSFISNNFFNKGKLVGLKNNYDLLFEKYDEKSNLIKKEIKKCSDVIDFLNEQKSSSMLKIPESFKDNKDIESFMINDESKKAEVLLDCLQSDNVTLFSSLLNENTNLSLDDVNNKIEQFTIGDEELSEYINKMKEDKKFKYRKIIIMQKIKKIDVFLLIITLLISMFSIVFVKQNVNHFDLTYLILSLVIGIIGILIFNINNGKNNNVIETFKDILSLCVFNSALIYNVLYLINNKFSFVYIFIEVPLIFVFMYSGVTLSISIIKYKRLLKKLSK